MTAQICSRLLGLAFVATAQAAKYGYNNPPLIQDNAAVSKNFPDVNGPELLGPAFTMQRDPGFANSTRPPNTIGQMNQYVKELAGRNEWATYHETDFVSEDGLVLPYLILSSPKSCNSTNKLRLWIQGGHHGDEPGSQEAVLSFLGTLDSNETYTQTLLSRLEVGVLPYYNIDGVGYLQRNFATNVDPNQVVDGFGPEVYLDMDEYTAASILGGKYLQPMDGLFSSGTHPLIHQSIRDLSNELFGEAVYDATEKLGIRTTLFTLTDGTLDGKPALREAFPEAKVGRNAAGLGQIFSFLHESRGIRLGDQHFQRRVTASYTMIKPIVDTAAKEFAASTEDVSVTFNEDIADRDWELVDVETGELTDVPVKIRQTGNLQANFTCPRPEAYIIPRPWFPIVEKLLHLGLEVEELEEPWSGEVEVLTITAMPCDNAGGVIQGAVRAEATTRVQSVPAGSFRISASQRMAALAFITLEPESVDSYVTQRILTINQGDELPFFRLLK